MTNTKLQQMLLSAPGLAQLNKSIQWSAQCVFSKRCCFLNTHSCNYHVPFCKAHRCSKVSIDVLFARHCVQRCCRASPSFASNTACACNRLYQNNHRCTSAVRWCTFAVHLRSLPALLPSLPMLFPWSKAWPCRSSAPGPGDLSFAS